jgi:alpha-glucosidase
MPGHCHGIRAGKRAACKVSRVSARPCWDAWFARVSWGEERRVSRWWEQAVVYQVYPRSFQDSNGDGIGDIAGVRQRLDYLVELGVDAFWLSPIYASPNADWGYDITDHTGVHPELGTLEDVRALIEAAHASGLRVLLDLVPSHTSIRHPWFREHRAPGGSA